EALIGSLEYSKAQTAALDVVAREGIARTTTTELVAERTELAQRLGEEVGDRRGEHERLAVQRSNAERAAAEARQLIDDPDRTSVGGGRKEGQPSAADRALEAQARERVDRLAARERDLKRASGGRGRSAADRAQDAVRYSVIGDEL